MSIDSGRAGPGLLIRANHREGAVFLIHLICPSCSQPLNIPSTYAGQQGRCNYCGAPIVVPQDEFQSVTASEVEMGSAPPYATPRRPARPGAGMLANEGEYERRGLGPGLMRVLLLGVLLIGAGACILPGLVIGFSAKTEGRGDIRPRTLPSTRGDGVNPSSGSRPPLAGKSNVGVGDVLSDTPAPSIGTDARKGELETVYVARTSNRYHKAGCPYLSEGSRALSRGEARSKGMVACKTCGG